MMDGSRFTIPEPPEHIKGNLHRFLPKQRRDDRDIWCRMMRDAGFTCRVIGAALGITAAMVHKHSSNAGYARNRERSPIKHHYLHNNGYRFGRPGDAFDASPIVLQHALVAYAAKHRCTITAAAFRMLEEKM